MWLLQEGIRYFYPALPDHLAHQLNLLIIDQPLIVASNVGLVSLLDKGEISQVNAYARGSEKAALRDALHWEYE